MSTGLLAFFVLLAWGVQAAGAAASGLGHWVARLLFVVAALAAMAAVGQRLPQQNAAACGAAVAATTWMLLELNYRLGASNARLQFSDALGAPILAAVPWSIPCLGVAIVLASRDTARLLLRPWRRVHGYGWWLLGGAAGLAAIQLLVLVPLGCDARGWWAWPPGRNGWRWFGVPWLSLVDAMGLTLILLLVALPWLLPKKPGGPSPVDVSPAVIWLLLLTAFGVNHALAGQWPLALIGLAAAGGVAFGVWQSRQRTLNVPAVTATPVSASAS